MPGPGFKDQKQKANINRNGRPKKGNAISDMIREILDEKPTIDPKTKELRLKKTKNPTMRRVFAESLVIRSLRSNAASRLVLSYSDGLPAQTLRHEGDGGAFGRIELWDLTREDIEKMANVEGQEKKKKETRDE